MRNEGADSSLSGYLISGAQVANILGFSVLLGWCYQPAPDDSELVRGILALNYLAGISSVVAIPLLVAHHRLTGRLPNTSRHQ